MKLGLTIKRRGLRLESELALKPGRGLVVLGDSADDNRAVLRALAGFDSAQLSIDDAPAPKPPKRHFALCAAEPQLFPQMTVEENLRLSAGEVSEKLWNNVLRHLQLDGLLQRRPGELSALQGHGVALARAIFNQPKLLLIDEPHLSDDERRVYIDRLVTLLPGLPFPVVSACRRLDEASRLGGHWLYLHEGKLRAQGEANALLLRDDLPLLEADSGAAFRIRTVVAGHNRQLGLSHLDFRGGRLLTPLCRCKVGREAIAMVPLAGARFSTTPPPANGGMSMITVRVKAIKPRGDEQALLELSADGTPLWLLLSASKVKQLGIAEGKPGYALYEMASVAAK